MAAVIAIGASVVAWQINDADAAPTMKPKAGKSAKDRELAPAV